MTREKKESLYMVGADGIEENRFQLWLIEFEDAAPTDTQGPLSSPLLNLGHCLPSQREGGGERGAVLDLVQAQKQKLRQKAGVQMN